MNEKILCHTCKFLELGWMFSEYNIEPDTCSKFDIDDPQRTACTGYIEKVNKQ